MDNFDLLDSSCTCWCGHPPCSFCVDTYRCEGCGHRSYADDCLDHSKHGFICENCQGFYAPKPFKYWFSLVLLWLFFIILFPLLVVVLSTYQTYKDFKKAGYQVPNFIQFVYEYSLTQTSYTKINKHG